MTIRPVVSGQSGLPVPNPSKSYWHKEPSQTLLGHRTTEALPETADVVIVGSGITGAFAAHFLKNDDKASGSKVVMLEAREACWGATGRVCDIPAFHLRRPETDRTAEWWSLPTDCLRLGPCRGGV
jgi:hypothetical protein